VTTEKKSFATATIERRTKMKIVFAPKPVRRHQFRHASGADVAFFVADDEAKKDGPFVPGKTFQPSLIFGIKTRSIKS
jgi:hypothetical protein